jgi:hypothetical protein
MAKEEVLIDVKIDEGDSVQSINSLRAAVKEMTKARNEANLQTAEGRATVQSLNQAIDANNAKIKSNIDALNKQRMNVGNYKKDIQEAIPALDQFSGGAASAGQGILTMTKQALAFIATPIGAILAAVAAVVGLLTAALKRSEPALDFFEDVIGSITEAARFLVDNLAAIASVLGNVFTGNIAEAAATTGKLAQEFKNAQREAQRLREEFRELEDEEAKLIASTAGTEAQIKALIIQSKNRNLTEKERIELLKQAEELEKTSTEKKVAYENRKSAATIQQIGHERDLRQAQGETIDAYVQRLIASEKLSGEEKKQVAEAYAARVNASTATLALQEKIQNAQDAAFLKQEEEAKVRSQVAREREIADSEFRLQLLRDENEEKKKILQELYDFINAKSFEAEVADIRRRDAEFERTVEELQRSKDWFLEEENLETESDIKRNENALQRLKQRTDQEIALKNFGEQQKLAYTSQALGQTSALLEKGSAEYKAVATSQALIDTYRSANAALAPPPVGAGPIFGPVFAALAIATGLMNVGKIQGFEKGGLLKMFNNGGVLNGPSHANGGIPFSVGGRLGFEAEGGEAIINKRSTSMFRPVLSAINAAGGGVKFADGGVMGFPNSTITSDSTSLFDLTRLEQSIANLRVQVAVTDINDGQKNYAEIIDRAQF